MNQLLYSIPLMLCAMKPIQAGVCVKGPGTLECGAGSINSCEGSGIVMIKGTHITQVARVSGQITISDAHMATLDSKGQATISQSQITHIKHSGAITLKDSRVGDIDIHTDSAVIQGGHVQEIVVHVNQVANVYLSHGAQVSQIRFIGGRGQVHAEKGTECHQIDNGQIV